MEIFCTVFTNFVKWRQHIYNKLQKVTHSRANFEGSLFNFIVSTVPTSDIAPSGGRICAAHVGTNLMLLIQTMIYFLYQFNKLINHCFPQMLRVKYMWRGVWAHVLHTDYASLLTILKYITSTKYRVAHFVSSWIYFCQGNNVTVSGTCGTIQVWDYFMSIKVMGYLGISGPHQSMGS